MPENLSFVLESVGKVKFEDRPVPVPGPKEVLIEVAVTGICGSDVHYYTHGGIGDFIVKEPMVLGHESAGKVVKLGDSVTTLAVGDRVALEPGVPGRYSKWTKSGRYNLDDDMKFAATPPYDGTLCKYYVLPEDFCYKLPESMSYEQGALIEPLAVGVHVARQACVKPGDKCAVFGAGPVGLLIGQICKAFNCGSDVTIVDISDARLEMAASLGLIAIKAGKTPEETSEKIIAALGGQPQAVLEASGAPPSIKAACLVVEKGGTYVQAGMGNDFIDGFPISQICIKEVSLKGSFRYSEGDYSTAIQLVDKGLVNVDKLITKKFPFAEAKDAFEFVKAGKGVKVLIDSP
ncbi:hypothetical protein CANCADRAFT_86620 [Tortispora caseinolytica NRRL Y-17796]|uniref:Enoyl reductase (ER) domain-containing protein n=1 Tax=Tortispora caseinolytica NRRL Y-17796 TaxID=767744 RepID=A0A1E4TKX5_9ASCO|nr:hypothetical protein CANCADRAFT_86620 [Tortispora caseinolytica NRRL Y-17796]